MKHVKLFEGFVNSLNESENIKLGDTGIILNILDKDNFEVKKDVPYIWIDAEDRVHFGSYRNDQTMTVDMNSTKDAKQGIFKYTIKEQSFDSSKETPSVISASGKSLDLSSAVKALYEITKALFGSVDKNNVKNTVLALKMIKTDYPQDIANNSLFSLLYTNILKIKSMRNLDEFAKNFSAKPEGAESIYNGSVEAFPKS